MDKSTFENIYEKYSPMLYGIALQIIPSKNKAEDLLILTFKKIVNQDVIQKPYPAYCIILMRLILKTAQEIYPKKFKNGFKLRHFENAPFLNQIICEQIDFQDHSEKNNHTRKEVLKIIHHEFRAIANKIDIAK
jgi:hypothetical protein